MVVNGASAHIGIGVLKLNPKLCLYRIKDFYRCLHHFRANAVPGQNCYFFHSFFYLS